METIFQTFQSVAVTWKIRSRSRKSKQLVRPSQQCIYSSRVKIHETVQKITHGRKSYADADTDSGRIRTIKQYIALPSGFWDIILKTNSLQFLKNNSLFVFWHRNTRPFIWTKSCAVVNGQMIKNLCMHSL